MSPKEIPVPPPDVAKLLAPKRRVILNRRSDRGFGFSLRRSTISERCQTRRTVLSAEPGNVGCGLLPGDRLLGIDDYDVEHAQQEHAVQKIKSAGQSVCLTVQPIPELTELSVRSPDGNETYLLSDDCIRELSFKQSLLSKGKLLRVEDDVPDEEWESGERLWLIHRAGIALCRVLPKDAPGSGKCYIIIQRSDNCIMFTP
jgi:myosin-18